MDLEDPIYSKNITCYMQVEGVQREISAAVQVFPQYLKFVLADRDLQIPLGALRNLEVRMTQMTLSFDVNNQMQKLTMGFADQQDIQEFMSFLPLKKEKSTDEFFEKIDYSAKNTPVTTVIIALNVLVFLVMYSTEKLNFMSPRNTQVFLEWGANNITETINQPWRLFTCAWLHFGLLHIGCNMYFLHAIGRLSEKLLGPIYYIIIYIFSAFCGSLASLIWNSDPITSAGASGAVFGVVGMIAAYLITQKSEVPPQFFKSLKNNLFQIVGLNFIFGMSVPGIDNAAHLGGLAGGFLGAFIMTRSLKEPSRKQKFVPKLILGLTILPAIILGIWESKVIQSKPIITLYTVSQEIIEVQNKIIDQSNRLVNQYLNNQVSSKEVEKYFTETANLWQEKLDRIDTIKESKKHQERIAEISSFLKQQLNYTSIVLLNLHNRQNLIDKLNNLQESK